MNFGSAGVLGRVGQLLRDDVARGQLDLLGQPRARADIEAHRYRGARSSTRPCRPATGISETSGS